MLLLAASLSAMVAFGPSSHDSGCQKMLSKVCPDWATEGSKACLACAHAHIRILEPNCTMQRIKDKCNSPPKPPSPGPAPPADPPAPPAPPITPRPGAPRPHVVLWVVDDLGWANVGFHNEGNVATPNADRLAAAGVILDHHYTYRCVRHRVFDAVLARVRA